MTACDRRPDVGRHVGGFLVERKHDAVGDERLESLHLPFERFAVADRHTISAQALKHCHRGNGQSPEVGEVLQRSFADARISSAQLRQRVGIEDSGLTLHGSAFPLPELSGEQVTLRRRNISETGDCQCKDPGRSRSDVDILAVVPAQQGDHLSLETPATSLRIRGDSLAECTRNANGACDRGFLRVDWGSLTHNQNSTRLVSRTAPILFFPAPRAVERCDVNFYAAEGAPTSPLPSA